MNDSAERKNNPKHPPKKRRLQFGLLGFLLVGTILPAPVLAWGQALRETWVQWSIASELEERCGHSIQVSVVWEREPDNQLTAFLGQRRVVEVSLVGYQSVPMESRHLSKEVLELIGELPYLETLVLEHVHIEFEGMRRLSKAESIGWLKVNDCEFENGEFPAVAALRNLVSVDFTGSHVGDETVKLLVGLPRLRSVDLRRGIVSKESMGRLIESSHLSFVATPDGFFSSGAKFREEGSCDESALRCCRIDDRNNFSE